jgi:hypothetical protein
VKNYILCCSLFVALQTCFGAEPFGEFVELHSCDLYTGAVQLHLNLHSLGANCFEYGRLARRHGTIKIWRA